MYRIAIDPGKNGLGVCCLDESTLIAAAWLTARPQIQPTSLGAWPTSLGCALETWISRLDRDIIASIIERPQTYRTALQKGDQKDVHDLSIIVGVCAYVLRDAYPAFTTPREWKGQTPKSVTAHRVDAVLTPSERERITWPSAALRHNVYDAIHLALKTFTTRPV